MEYNSAQPIHLERILRFIILPGLSSASNLLYNIVSNRISLPIVCGNYNDKLHINRRDLVFLEVSNPGQAEQNEILHDIQIQHPEASVCLFGLNEKDNIYHLLKHPVVKGAICSDQGSDHLLKAIRTIDAGSYWFSRKHLDTLASMRKGLSSSDLKFIMGLTKRESQVLMLLTQGLSTVQLAEKLYLSHHTVKTHKNNIYRKLGVNSGQEAIAWAMSHVGSTPDSLITQQIHTGR